MLVRVVVLVGQYPDTSGLYFNVLTMGKNYRSVVECHNYSRRVGKYGTKVKLHKLPKEQYTKRAWIGAISRKKWTPSSFTRVCSDHFVGGVGPNSIKGIRFQRKIYHRNDTRPRDILEIAQESDSS